MENPDWAFRAGDDAILAALASGRHAASLAGYFGPDGYRDLAALARAPVHAPRRAAPVLVLPGIMGSRLGDVWFEPAAIGAGRLAELALPAGRALRPRGVQMLTYAHLVLALRRQGLDVRLRPYDWRRPLDELGQALAADIRSMGRPVTVVAHSMGGLVARIAIAQLPRRCVRRLILVGTPNYGSFAAVQALRGSYGFVRKLARLDPRHTAEYLAGRVFHSFPGLYQLLPAGGARGIPDLSRRQRWPRRGLRPDEARLAEVRRVRAALAPPDGRFVQIAGAGRATVTGLVRSDAGFRFRMGWGGDGTVPLRHCVLPGVATYYSDELHARLPCNGGVIRAIIDLVLRGRTSALPQRWRPRRTRLAAVDEATLRRIGRGKIDWQSLDARTREAVLLDLNS